MALIVSLLALAAAHRCASLSRAACSAAGDIDDPPLPLRRSLLARFRERRALAVIDITATEWCDKQMEFVLEHGRPERTEAMKAGSDRHAQLEEVIERVDVAIRTAEESWAVKFMNFIVGTNQLLFDGITRENFRWSWMAGVIDEIRMPTDGASSHPILVDTKTRSKPTIPSEAHKRNGRLQLMCYKYLWDNLNTEKFPAENFFIYFDLNPNFLLSDDVKWYISSLGFDAKTFEDVLKYFKVTCHTVPRSQEQLLLRYELLADHSLLVEYQFPYDARWFKDQIQEALSFWVGAREAKFVIEEESWKCQFCKFVSNCPKMASTSGC
ncbi:exonuclease V, chloroplastic-like isoform X2 [Phragmites australis]|uniref:exonuclease V, chloroplastic-like isoform X2 n=1 Tax=Phragmites australis TaxID=29695 RepID=UPI002D784ABD|nr:exonuclease V, chloroplastic-like isoform X2 [Phragmites australis]